MVINLNAKLWALLPLYYILSSCQFELPKSGTIDKNQILLSTVSFELNIAMNLEGLEGSSLGTLFELKNDNGTIVAAAGFSNAVNTFNTVNKSNLNFFYNVDSASTKVVFEDLDNPIPGNNEPNRIFTLNDSLFAIGFEKGIQKIKKYDAANKTWRDTEWIAKDKNLVLKEIQLFGSSILCVYTNQIMLNEDTLFVENSKGNSILAFSVQGANFFIYSHAIDSGYLNKIYVGNISRTADDLKLNLDTIYEGFCEYPQSCGVYGWGVLDNSFIISTNYGHVLKFNSHSFEYIYKKENENYSWQLYGFIKTGGMLLAGHYPTGNLVQINPNTLDYLPNEIPIPENATNKYREAQTLAIYGGNLIVGLWPWAELWKLNAFENKWEWFGRVFDKPEINEEDAPFVNRIMEKNGVYNNNFGQRVIDMVCLDSSLYINTSFKNIITEDLKDLLTDEELTQYGKVYRAYAPGHISSQIKWKENTVFKFEKKLNHLRIFQDGELLGQTLINQKETQNLYLTIGGNIYGLGNLNKINFQINADESGLALN